MPTKPMAQRDVVKLGRLNTSSDPIRRVRNEKRLARIDKSGILNVVVQNDIPGKYIVPFRNRKNAITRSHHNLKSLTPIR